MRGRSRMAHRVAFEDANGILPSRTIDVHHKCHVRACVNPDHLEAVSEVAHVGAHSEKVTPAQVADIRRRHVPRVVTRKMLAAEFGVSVGCIKHILAGDRSAERLVS